MNILEKKRASQYLLASITLSFCIIVNSKSYNHKENSPSLLEDATRFHSQKELSLATRLLQVYPFSAHTFLSPELNSYPAETSFWIIDLKFDDQTNELKICELGNGRYAGFKGYHALYGQGVIWQRFWRFLELLHIPLWYVGSSFERETLRGKNVINGTSIPLITNFSPTKNSRFNGIFDPQNILSHDGLLVFHSSKTSKENTQSIKKRFPRIMQLNEATNRFISNKKETNLLFEGDSQLMHYKPKFKIYKKQYYPTLAEQIMNDLACKIFVIKPLNSSQGNGIIIVEKENLDETLKLIFSTDGSLEKFKTNPSYYFWKKDSNKEFLVEEYAQSKKILVGKNYYDPTMRVVCFLYNHNGYVRSTFFASYWKLPEKPLNKEGSLTQKHKSKIIPGKSCSARVAAADFETVSTMLSEALPRLYTKMLGKYFSSTYEN